VTEIAEHSSPSDERRRRRVPRWVLITVAIVLLPVLAFGGVWVSYKKPWLMDDFRAGFTVGEDLQARDVGKRDDPCGEAMASRYGGEASYTYDTSEDQAAFYWGCWRGLSGVSNDWWNVSGYLTA
jgi:hypothetical protein